jgi:hypothetical protein
LKNNPISKLGVQKNKISGVPAQIGIGAGIENSRYGNKSKLKNQSDVNADMFAKMADKFKSRDGGRPRGLWNNFGAGVMEGMEYGARSQGVRERKEDYDKYDRVMEYFSQVNNAAMEQNAWHENRETAKREMMPQVLAYMDNIERLDPQSQRIMAQDMLAQYGEAIGQEFKLSSIDGSNPFLMTIQSEKGQQLFDLRSMFAGDEAIQQSIAMKMPEYQMRLQQERADKEREFKIKEDAVANRSDAIEETRRRNDQTANKSDMKLAETFGKKIDASREFLTIAPKMEQIVNDHPDIFQSAIDAVWRENKEPGYISNMTKDLQNKWNPEKVAALTSMVKYINKMTLDVANGFARPNMFIEKIGSKAVPNLDMNPQGFLNVLGEMVEENKTAIKNNQERFDLLQSDLKSGITDQYRESTANVMGEGASDGNNPFGSRWQKVQ